MSVQHPRRLAIVSVQHPHHSAIMSVQLPRRPAIMSVQHPRRLAIVSVQHPHHSAIMSVQLPRRPAIVSVQLPRRPAIMSVQHPRRVVRLPLYPEIVRLRTFLPFYRVMGSAISIKILWFVKASLMTLTALTPMDMTDLPSIAWVACIHFLVKWRYTTKWR